MMSLQPHHGLVNCAYITVHFERSKKNRELGCWVIEMKCSRRIPHIKRWQQHITI